MTRPRLSAWLLAGLLWTAQPATRSLGQQKSLFPSKVDANVPAASDALRHPKRRPEAAPRGDTVPLPFNLVWGDSERRLSSLFAGVGAQITNKKATGPLETWTVQGLIAPDLQSSLFTFAQGSLVALEFDYGQSSWDLPKYNDTMGRFRKLLDGICEKPGEIVSRQTDEPAADPALKQSLMGYQWRRDDTLVQLFYFSAEDTVKSLTYRTISVHYHYQDPADLEAANAANAANAASGAADGANQEPGAHTGANTSLFPHAPSPVTPDADPLPER